MLLRIAAAYGQPLGTERVKELGAIIAGGFAFRTIARQFLGLVPGFGWAVKGSIAYGGTVAMGKAAIEYFEEGADVGSIARDLLSRAESLPARLSELRGGTRGEIDG
jgi:uncharacterized protein (DUF697 family)